MIVVPARWLRYYSSEVMERLNEPTTMDDLEVKDTGGRVDHAVCRTCEWMLYENPALCGAFMPVGPHVQHGDKCPQCVTYVVNAPNPFYCPRGHRLRKK